MESNQASHDGDAKLGALVYQRKHTNAAYTAAAGFIFGAPTICLSSIVLFTKQNPGVKPMSVAEKLGMIAFIALLSGGAGLFLFIKGRLGRKTIEVYERGVRLQRPGGDKVVFEYADVREIKRRTFNGALAAVEFTLPDGASDKIDVHGSRDVQLLNYILEHYRPITWEQDNSFRIM